LAADEARPVDITDRLELTGGSADGFDCIRGSTDRLEWTGGSSVFSRSSTYTPHHTITTYQLSWQC